MRISQSEIDLDDIISDLHSVQSEVSSAQAHNPVTSQASKLMEQQKRTAE